EYPDSGKITVFAGAAPGGDKAARRIAASFLQEDAVDYWEGE
ncbi:MAG TPA: cupin, partial [Citreicella sp.]|nr:cupin [Citreicella sp.]